MKMVSSRKPFCRRRIGMISLLAIRVSSVAALALRFIVTCRPNIFPAPRLVAVDFRRSGFDSRGAEKGVSQTRFTRTLRRQTLYVKCRIYLAQRCKAALNEINVRSEVSNLKSSSLSSCMVLPHTKYIAYPHYISCLTYMLEQRTLCLTE